MARPEKTLTIQDHLELITCGVNITSGSMALKSSACGESYAFRERCGKAEAAALTPKSDWTSRK
jgi:hypothetical protein